MAIYGLGPAVNVLVARDLYAMTQMWLFARADGVAVGRAPQLCAYFDVTWAGAGREGRVRRTFAVPRD